MITKDEIELIVEAFEENSGGFWRESYMQEDIESLDTREKAVEYLKEPDKHCSWNLGLTRNDFACVVLHLIRLIKKDGDL